MLVLGARLPGPWRRGRCGWSSLATPGVPRGCCSVTAGPARPAMKQEGASRRRGDKAKAPPDGPPPAPPDVEMQEEAAATETAGERQPQRELDAITLEGEGGGPGLRGAEGSLGGEMGERGPENGDLGACQLGAHGGERGRASAGEPA